MGNLSQLFGLALLNNGDASPVREFFFRLELPAKAQAKRVLFHGQISVWADDVATPIDTV